MASQEPSSGSFVSSPSNAEDEVQEESYQSIHQRLLPQVTTTFPRTDVISVFGPLYYYDGWCGIALSITNTMVAQKYFKARPTDVLVATMPKSGTTTWIKALVFATENRHSDAAIDYRHFLESYNPHECFHFLEYEIYTDDKEVAPDLSELPEPRLFSTHIPFQSLPASVIDAGCRVVYLSRNPKDNFVSSWHFSNRARNNAGVEPEPIEEALDNFCKGTVQCGPYWDHVLGYWRAHLERPQQVLFVKYEELKAEPVAQLKRLAEFLGCPFSAEEEKDGVVDGIVRLCDIENLRNLEVNKSGTVTFGKFAVENSSFFRRGVVGGWKNELTPEMVDRFDKVMEQKFRGSGLTF